MLRTTVVYSADGLQQFRPPEGYYIRRRELDEFSLRLMLRNSSLVSQACNAKKLIGALIDCDMFSHEVLISLCERPWHRYSQMELLVVPWLSMQLSPRTTDSGKLLVTYQEFSKEPSWRWFLLKLQKPSERPPTSKKKIGQVRGHNKHPN